MGKGGPEACFRRPKTLLALLHLLGRALDVRRRFHPEKADLTFSDPLVRGARREKVKRRKVIWRLRKGPIWTRVWMGSVSLKSITYDYMYHFLLKLGGDLEDLDAVDKVFGQNAVEYLAERGYGPEDVVVWAWILMAKDEHEAAMRIDVWARLGANMAIDSHGEDKILNESLKDSIGEIFQGNRFNPLDSDDLPDLQAQPITRSYQIPPFIILHNLRRPHAHINARLIRQLLPHIERSLFSPKSFQSGDFKTPLLILIRLLRHARSSWPPAVPLVADLLTKVHSSDRPPRRTARLTNTYNRLLTLTSLAPNDRPFQSMLLLQQSQFTLLRKMASLDIPITREGYRALITVQLSHPKTHAEALHVKSLSTNWPPWPVPKDGHHLSPGHSSSPHLSRAAQVLQQMTAAGYHHLGWEKEALVLSGTDTDYSPTIQTRTFYRSGRSSPNKDPQNIWAVRIRATRTLDEAWNIFLECTSTIPAPAPLVWEEMFYKVVSARKANRLLESHQQRLEAIKATHDPSLPPTPETLQAIEKWDIINREMAQRKKRVLPGDAKEVAIPPASPSERVYVPIKPPTVDELLSMMRRVCGKNVHISPYLLAQLVREADNLEQGERLITLWSQEQFRRLLKSAQHDVPRAFARYEAYADWHLLTSYLSLLLRTPTPPRIDLALRLLRGQSPRYPPAWNVVLTALTNISLHMPQGVKTARLELVWRLYSSMAQLRAQPDSETLRVLCVAAERATWTDVQWGGEKPVDVMTRVVQSAFGIGRTGEVPLLGPDMAALHAYVRMVGFSGREDAIAVLVGWMKEAGLDVTTVTGRRVVVACAVFVKDEVLVRELADGWAGVEWPGEDEVERYCVRGWTGKVIEKEDSGGLSSNKKDL